MRILFVTARRGYRKGFFEDRLQVIEDDLGPGHEVTVLAVHPPKRPRPVHRFVVVDPSSVPFRPVTDFPVKGRPLRLRWTHQVVRLMRLGRQAWSKVARRPESDRAGDHLAVACRTSREPARLARESDVIIALDSTAALGVWHLARRVPGKAYVFGVRSARDVLERRGVALPPLTSGVVAAEVATDESHMPDLPDEPVRLLIAPANYAGQARQWADAVTAHVPGAAAQNFRRGKFPDAYVNDLQVDPDRFATDLAWRRYWRRHVVQTYTHVLAEAGLPFLGASVLDAEDEIRQLQRAGLRVARLAHGSEVRIPSVHAAWNRWAPYEHLDPKQVRRFESTARRNVDAFSRHDGPVFVSTLGLLEFLPKATWLPLTVDTDRTWVSDTPLFAGERPVVAHAPSGPQKGSHHIDPVLRELDEQGVITYRRVEKVPHREMPRVYGTADVVIDQFGVADYGAAACEAMSLGRLVVSHVSPAVREDVLDRTGRELPIVEADPDTLREVLLDLLADRERAVELSRASREFATLVHSGRRSAEVLGEWLLADRA